MNAVLLDTHIWAWSLSDNEKLNGSLRKDISNARLVYVSPVSIFEIAQKVRIGKWPAMQPYVRQLPELLISEGARVASFTPEIGLEAALMEWENRDPFDRLLAATAIAMDVGFVTMDMAFQGLANLRLLTSG